MEKTLEKLNQWCLDHWNRRFVRVYGDVRIAAWFDFFELDPWRIEDGYFDIECGLDFEFSDAETGAFLGRGEIRNPLVINADGDEYGDTPCEMIRNGLVVLGGYSDRCEEDRIDEWIHDPRNFGVNLSSKAVYEIIDRTGLEYGPLFDEIGDECERLNGITPKAIRKLWLKVYKD